MSQAFYSIAKRIFQKRKGGQSDPKDFVCLIAFLLRSPEAHVKYDPNKTLILFTNDRRAEATAIHAAAPETHELISTTKTGQLVAELDLFNNLPYELAFLAWCELSRQLVQDNEHSKILLVGNSQNPLSILWNLEALLLCQKAPCEILEADTGTTLSPSALRVLSKNNLKSYLLKQNGPLSRWIAEHLQNDHLIPEAKKREDLVLALREHLLEKTPCLRA